MKRRKRTIVRNFQLGIYYTYFQTCKFRILKLERPTPIETRPTKGWGGNSIDFALCILFLPKVGEALGQKGSFENISGP